MRAAEKFPARRRVWTDADTARALALHREGLTSFEIAARLGASPSRVRTHIREAKAKEQTE